MILEAGPRPAGSWPRYYDSLTLFSPAGYSSMPGLDFPGDAGRYPHRDEVVAYLHHWFKVTGADLLPPEWLRRYLGGRTVLDTGKYQHALQAEDGELITVMAQRPRPVGHLAANRV